VRFGRDRLAGSGPERVVAFRGGRAPQRRPLEGPALEIPALLIVAVAILAVALLISRLSARDAAERGTETPKKVSGGQAPDPPSAGLPAVVDRSIGMYLLRRIRGQPTLAAGDDAPSSLLTADELAHRIGFNATPASIEMAPIEAAATEAAAAPTGTGAPPPLWAKTARTATSMGMVVRPTPLARQPVVPAEPLVAEQPAVATQPVVEPAAAPLVAATPRITAPVLDVAHRRPGRRTAGFALVGVTAMLGLAIVAVPGFSAPRGKILDLTQADPSHGSSATLGAPRSAAPTSEVAGETSDPTGQPGAATSSPTAGGQSFAPAATPTTPAKATPRVTPRATARPTIAPTAKPTAAATPIATPPRTPDPTPSPTPEPTPSPTPEPTPGATP
jgi:hypothetical protein